MPGQARTIATDDFLLVRYPDWFFHPTELARFTPSGDVDAALDAALSAARTFDRPDGAALTAWVRLDAPEGLLDRYVDRGGVVDETLDVLALALTDGPPARPWRHRRRVEVRWVDDVPGLRDVAQVSVEVFGGKPVPKDELEPSLAHWRKTRGRGTCRAMLAERLAEGVRQGAVLALVKGRVETSGPILRRAGFRGYGRETSCTIAL